LGASHRKLEIVGLKTSIGIQILKLENFYERIKMIHDMKTNNETRSDYEYDTGLYDTLGNRVYKLEPTVYILDSIAILMPEKFADEDELSGNSAAMSAARVVTGIMKRIVPMLKSANIILFVVNHILENPQLTIVPTKGQLAYLKQNERLPVGKTFIHL
jgi:predicted ATP-dependent serine protease